MTNAQESLSNMYLTLVLFCDSNSEITNALPFFTDNLNNLKDNNTQLRKISEQQKLVNTGVTRGKNELRAQLIILAADTARKLSTYARFTKNTALLDMVNYSENDFKRFSDQEVVDYAHLIYNQAQPIVDSLADYAITISTQGELLDTNESYKAALVIPRLGATTKIQATKQLAALFINSNESVANMDAAVEIVRLKNKDFYNGYKTARKVIKKGVVKLSVKGTVSDAATGELLKNVIVSFVLVGGLAKSAIIKKSAAKGGFYMKSLAAGTYTVTFTKPGYADQVVTANVNDGELTIIEVKMVIK